MSKLQSWLLTICGCFACVAVGIFALQGREAIVAAESSSGGIGTKINATLDSANTTLALINAPCTGFHGSVTCGSIAQIDQTTKNFGIVAGQTALQVKQSGLLIETAAQNMNTVGMHVSEVADSLNQTAKATTTAVNQATMDLATANTTIASAQPLLTHLNDVAVSANAAVIDFDAAERDPNWSAVLKNVAGITNSTDLILARGYLVENKATQCYLYPTFKCRVNSLIVPTFQIAGPLIQAFK